MQRGRFAGSNEMEETLSHVQKHMMDTCSMHGILEWSKRNKIFLYVLFGLNSLLYLFGWKFHPTQVRMRMPSKPILTLASIGGDDGYAELSTKFKASHIKRIVWWLTLESQKYADAHPTVPRLKRNWLEVLLTLGFLEDTTKFPCM